jgi:hypothetical protein
VQTIYRPQIKTPLALKHFDKQLALASKELINTGASDYADV